MESRKPVTLLVILLIALVMVLGVLSLGAAASPSGSEPVVRVEDPPPPVSLIVTPVWWVTQPDSPPVPLGSSYAGTDSVAEPNRIDGSTITETGCYRPGDTETICFTVYNASPDTEWLDGITLTLPAGWTVACKSQDELDYGSGLKCGTEVIFLICSAAGNSVSYNDSDGSLGEVHDDCSWDFCVDVTAPASASGSQTVDWELSGDEWPDPPHDITGTLSINGCGQSGWLDGDVMDSELVDTEPTCTEAVVHIEPGSQNVTADSTGHYGPVALAIGTYTVTASASGYSAGGPYTVDVVAGMTTTQDFGLWRPVIKVIPEDFISTTAIMNQPVTHTLTISNPGHLPLDFDITELAPGGDYPWVWENPGTGIVSGPGEMAIDVTFYCTEMRDYDGFLSVGHNDPCEIAVIVPIELHCLAPLEWDKWINDENWTSGISFTVETSDTIEIRDVISTALPFTLTETWNPAHLALTDYQVEPPGTGEVVTGAGTLEWTVTPAGSEIVTLTKSFHVEPGTWPETLIEEVVSVGEGQFPQRDVRITQWVPILWITSEYEQKVTAGQAATFELLYGNDGADETGVMIRNEFPAEALFDSSEPAEDRVDAGGLWAEWDIGNLATGNQGSIEVTVTIAEGLSLCTWITITDWIYDHLGDPADAVTITFHVQQHRVYLPVILRSY